MGNQSKALRSGELAKLAGISPDTLRLYERKGLFARPPRSANGYRCYPPEAMHRIRLIRAALSIGFTLDELSEIFTLRDRNGVPCALTRELAGMKLRNLEAGIRELTLLRGRLRKVLTQWDSALKKTPRGERAGLLEQLAIAIESSVRSLPPQFYASLGRKKEEK